MSDTVIVVPCYNEAERLPVQAFREFVRRTHGIRFLFVDDGSTDATAGVLHALKASAPDCFDVHTLAVNAGKGEAVRHGFLAALESDPDYIGFWDADLATPLDAIREFRGVLDGRPDVEMAFGARVRLLGRAIRRNRLRHLLGRLFAVTASLFLRVDIYDTQCGAKLFRATPDLPLLFQEPFATRWIFDVEIIARLMRARSGTARPQVRDILYEVPLSEWRDTAGSKIRVRDFVIAIFGMIDIIRKYR
ncbi:MAG: glycosyltransferase [Gemmatimonadota bacterium]|nr:glycosyltransferase [Gemmatimonadota bacterium]